MVSSISFDPTLRRATAEGPAEFVVAIAQQISWLGAACQKKPNHLSCAYIGFRDVYPRAPSSHGDDATAMFDVTFSLKRVPSQASVSCWHSLVGPAVIVRGFPVPKRESHELGLEVSVAGMAAMARIPTAISFDGGFIFKGRCHALVPVQKTGKSVQWHMLDTSPKRLGWNEIRRLCPVRLVGHIEEYAALRSFVGWYPTVLHLLGAFSLPVYQSLY